MDNTVSKETPGLSHVKC